ncbi:lipase family protein [Aeromonas schubertii]|uniref:lipase family protein n=1 Tax=Aeromonas schubertii TaxID=652 RepID=UPI0010A839F7|nr:lipase family protein [Aeromonas schubertii]QCG49324.1 lipase family protein [Aeromonas schubertii]
MNKLQGCVDCNNFVYSFDIELVDELEQPISDIDYEILLERNNLVLAKGKTDGQGKISVEGLPSLPLRLVLDTAKFLEEMQEPQRHLRLGRTLADSTVKPRAEQQGREYSYATVGKLINELPVIPDWPEKRDLPAFHFPDKAPKGWSIRPRGKDHKHRKLTLEVCPFRAWVLMLHNGPEYSLVNGYNLSLMSILAYADGERDEHGSKAGALKPYVEQVLTHLGRLPFKVNTQYLAPVVKDVPFAERYRHYDFIDTSSDDMGKVGNTQLLYMVNNEHAVVAWRGTVNLEDVATDLYGIQGADPILPSGKIHLGFKNAYQDISANKKLEDAKKIMDGHLADKPLFICGHSLGGALALIHAAEHRAKKPHLYTYGMPRVFDRTAIAQLNEIVHYRHINNNDFVTAIPHPKWGSMRMLLALSTALLPYPTPAKYSPEVRRYLDSQDYQHHGKIIHFSNFSMAYDTGPGYQNMGWMASYGKTIKTMQLKSLFAPSLIVANAQKAYELVTRQYSRADLDNPDRKVIDAPEHSSTNYARYLGDRLYDRLCQDHGTPSHFEQQAKKIKQVAHSSIDKDKPAQFDAFLQADARVLAQSLLPVAVQPIETNGLERCYLYAMQLPKEAIRSEQAEVAKESQQLKEQINSDANYQLHRQASYLDPGDRATLPKVDDSVKESIKLANQQANGMKEMAALLQ